MTTLGPKYDGLKKVLPDVFDATGFLDKHGRSFQNCYKAFKTKHGLSFYTKLTAKAEAFDGIVADTKAEDDTDTGAAVVENIRRECNVVKDIINRKQNNSAQNLLHITEATVRFLVYHQDLWMRMSGRLAQVQEDLQNAHKYSERMIWLPLRAC